MKFIFINRFFYPDESATSQMLSDLAFTLAQRQQAITVITSRQRYDQPGSDLAPNEIIEGVSVCRVWTSRFGRHKLLGRSIDYLTFYLSAAWQLYLQARTGDVVVVKTDPPVLSIITLPVCIVRRARLVNWLQDVFPETAQALGYATGIMRLPYRSVQWLRDCSLNGAAMNVVVGARMADYISALGVSDDRLRVIPNWANGRLVASIDHEANPLRLRWNLDRAFVIGYSGNLGRAHEIRTMLEGMKVLAGRREMNQRPMEWLFIGGGALYSALKTEVARLGLNSVHFKPYQPRTLLPWSLSVPDVHIISLRPELEGFVVPSKFYGAAAAGRPIIFIGDSSGEIAGLIERHQCGYTIAIGDEAMLADTIADLAAKPSLCREMGERARHAFVSEFDMPIAMEQWHKLLCDISGLTRSAIYNGTASRAVSYHRSSTAAWEGRRRH